VLDHPRSRSPEPERSEAEIVAVARLLEVFPQKQADVLAHVVIKAHDDLVNRADFHALTGVVSELASAQPEEIEGALGHHEIDLVVCGTIDARPVMVVCEVKADRKAREAIAKACAAMVFTRGVMTPAA
jgi:hypothetical protein